MAPKSSIPQSQIAMPNQLLNLRSVDAAYGKGQVLWDVAFDLGTRATAPPCSAATAWARPR